MKKYIKRVFLGLGAIVLVILVYTSVNFGLDVHEYNQNVKSTTEIAADELDQKIKEDKEVLVYFGRGTCPYCRNFVKELDPAIKETHAKVYYVNT